MENMVDAQCLRFNSYKICSHTVAVADYNEELHKLVEYIKKHSKNRINDLTDVNLSSNVRQKRRKTLKKGGDKHNLKPVKHTQQCMSQTKKQTIQLKMQVHSAPYRAISKILT